MDLQKLTQAKNKLHSGTLPARGGRRERAAKDLHPIFQTRACPSLRRECNDVESSLGSLNPGEERPKGIQVFRSTKVHASFMVVKSGVPCKPLEGRKSEDMSSFRSWSLNLKTCQTGALIIRIGVRVYHIIRKLGTLTSVFITITIRPLRWSCLTLSDKDRFRILCPLGFCSLF